jgi:hypothetical protein
MFPLIHLLFSYCGSRNRTQKHVSSARVLRQQQELWQRRPDTSTKYRTFPPVWATQWMQLWLSRVNFCRMIRAYRSHLTVFRVPVIISFVTISLLFELQYSDNCSWHFRLLIVSGNCPSSSIPNRRVSETESVSIHT